LDLVRFECGAGGEDEADDVAGGEALGFDGGWFCRGRCEARGSGGGCGGLMEKRAKSRRFSMARL
jgi:hypothetical protein